MPLTMKSHWECDGCHNWQVMQENEQPAGWRHVHVLTPSEGSYRLSAHTSERIYFICPACWFQCPWSEEPIVEEPLTGVRACGTCRAAVPDGYTVCPRCHNVVDDV